MGNLNCTLNTCGGGSEIGDTLIMGHCKVIEDMLNEVVLVTQKEIAEKLIKNTELSLEDIAEITELSVDDMESINIEQCHHL